MFDAYNGVYEDNYRFWTGVRLVARLPLVIATAVAENPSELLLSILGTVIALLLTFALCLRGLYQKNIHNVLESWYLLNIALVAVISINSPQAVERQLKLQELSVAVLFLLHFLELLLVMSISNTKSVAKLLVTVRKKKQSKDAVETTIHNIENAQEIGSTYIDVYND